MRAAILHVDCEEYLWQDCVMLCTNLQPSELLLPNGRTSTLWLLCQHWSILLNKNFRSQFSFTAHSHSMSFVVQKPPYIYHLLGVTRIAESMAVFQTLSFLPQPPSPPVYWTKGGKCSDYTKLHTNIHTHTYTYTYTYTYYTNIVQFVVL